MLKFVDDWIFDNRICGYQKLANAFQRLTGLTCFFLAKCCWIGFVVLYAVPYFLGEGIVVVPTTAFENTLRILFMVGTPFILWKLSEDEKWLRTDTMNPRRIRPSELVLRLVSAVALSFLVTLHLLITAPLSLTGTVAGHEMHTMFIAISVLLVSFYYFGACTPLLPQKSLFRQWCERALTEVDRWATRPEQKTA